MLCIDERIQLANDIFKQFALNKDKNTVVLIKKTIKQDNTVTLSDLEIDEILEYLIELGWLRKVGAITSSENEYKLTFKGRIIFNKGGLISYLRHKRRKRAFDKVLWPLITFTAGALLVLLLDLLKSVVEVRLLPQ